MTMAGKKLQVIYDKGSEELTNIETKASGKLKKLSDTQNEKRKVLQAGDATKIESKSAELEQDIRKVINESLVRLESTKTKEIQSCHEQVDELGRELKNVSEIVKRSLQQLIDSNQERLEDVELELTYEFDTNLDQKLGELEKQTYASSGKLTAHGNTLVNSLQQKLDQNVWASKGSEKAVVTQLYKNYMKKANTIEQRFSSLMQQLSSHFQDKFKVVEEASKSIDIKVDSYTDETMSNLDTRCTDIEREINTFFGEMLSENIEQLDKNLGSIASDISSTHASLTGNLTQKTRDFSNSLTGLSDGMKERMSSNFQEVGTRADLIFKEFMQATEQKVTNSLQIREELEKAKEETIRDIHDELASVREDFQKKVEGLMSAAEEDLQRITQDVEKEIQATQTRCLNKLAQDGQACKQEIDSQVANLLAAIKEHKRVALADISSAAAVGKSMEL